MSQYGPQGQQPLWVHVASTQCPGLDVPVRGHPRKSHEERVCVSSTSAHTDCLVQWRPIRNQVSLSVGATVLWQHMLEVKKEMSDRSFRRQWPYGELGRQLHALPKQTNTFGGCVSFWFVEGVGLVCGVRNGLRRFRLVGEVLIGLCEV